MLVNSATSDEYRHSFLTQIAQHIFLESFKLNWNDGLVPPPPPSSAKTEQSYTPNVLYRVSDLKEKYKFT